MQKDSNCFFIQEHLEQFPFHPLICQWLQTNSEFPDNAARLVCIMLGNNYPQIVNLV